jgi:hypothetical protein
MSAGKPAQKFSLAENIKQAEADYNAQLAEEERLHRRREKFKTIRQIAFFLVFAAIACTMIFHRKGVTAWVDGFTGAASSSVATQEPHVSAAEQTTKTLKAVTEESKRRNAELDALEK